MLTRFVRTQLIIFTIVGSSVCRDGLRYMQVPTLLGVGKITVKLQLPATGGLYRFSNVTYRGVQIGKVTEVGLTPNGAQATLSLDTSPKIPADLRRRCAASPRSASSTSTCGRAPIRAPYLQDGSVIAVNDTTIPQAVGPVLDQVSKLSTASPRRS